MVIGPMYVPSIFTSWCPTFYDFSLLMYYDFYSWWCKWRCIKSNRPCSWACAERVGFILEGRRRFNMTMSWGNRRHHKWMGKSLCVDKIPEMKWFLKDCIALSAAFCRCRCGGTSWKFSFSSYMHSFKNLEHLLSNTCIFGVSPLLQSNFRIVWYVF